MSKIVEVTVYRSIIESAVVAVEIEDDQNISFGTSEGVEFFKVLCGPENRGFHYLHWEAATAGKYDSVYVSDGAGCQPELRLTYSDGLPKFERVTR